VEQLPRPDRGGDHQTQLADPVRYPSDDDHDGNLQTRAEPRHPAGTYRNDGEYANITA
jgi:hypothetical protein